MATKQTLFAYFLKNKLIYLGTLLISIIIAARFPIGNDEAYYIAFAKHLQLSYIDAPPFVAYLNLIQAKLGIFNPLANRGLVIVLHLIATIFLMLIVKNNQKVWAYPAIPTPDNNSLADILLITFLLAYIIPIFGLYGIFILPDSGLILGLSIMLWASDNIVREKTVSIKNHLFLALGLGIGLLAKYHILPLGIGMLVGLYLDLIFINQRCSLVCMLRLILSVIFGTMVAAPVFIWNYTNHYASFIFQLQHGFSANSWQLSSMFEFILGVLAYLTPWFTYILAKYGLLTTRRYYLLIPVISLSFILIISSMRKNILPHWLAPAFWLLIPYAVIHTSNLRRLKAMCKYTSVIWLALLFILLLPGGISNIKPIGRLFNPDATGLADLLLWAELPQLFASNTLLQQSLSRLNGYSQLHKNCHSQYRLIGTVSWYWSAQLEYHEVFGPNYKILNLDPNSSNFYNWRDNLSAFANCPLLLIANKNANLTRLLNMQKSYAIHGLGDYKSLNLTVIEGVFKDAAALTLFQQNLLHNPHY